MKRLPFLTIVVITIISIGGLYLFSAFCLPKRLQNVIVR
jgi:hypothetical protein